MVNNLIKIKILLVEDDENIAHTLIDYFQTLDFLIHWSSNGVAGLKSIKTFVPDVIVCDLMMPVMNGEEFYKTLKKNDSFNSIPFLIISADSSIDSKLKQLRLGANDYIIKPFKFEELVYKIKNLLDYKDTILLDKKQIKFNKLNLNLKTFENHLDEFLLENIMSNFDISLLAEHLNMSNSTLDKTIRKKFRVNISTYVRQFRLEYAISLMNKGFESITEIAFQSGFSSASYFSTSFKKYKSKTPKEYIKTIKVK
ncbi:MAG: response regulator [Flavobacteriaceae bacterium]|nr:response regulator [Flavobacteriaceae bacterium]